MYNWRQFITLPKIKDLTPQQQKAAYYRMMEANDSSAAAASSSAAGAGGAGGGSGSRRRTVENAGASLYYKLEDGVFEYAVTNFDKGTTTPIKTRNYTPGGSGIYTDFVSQNGGFFVWVQDNTEAKDFLLFIDLKGGVKEIEVDYSIDINNGSTAQHYIIYYQVAGTTYFKVFDGDGLREFSLDVFVSNVFSWPYANTFYSGFCVQTQADNVASLYAVRNGSTTPTLITTIDSDVQDWNVYMHSLHDRIMVKRTNRTDFGVESLTVYDVDGTELSNIDMKPFATAPYVIQNADTKAGIATNQGCTVEYLALLNPEYDLDNLVEGDTINGYSELQWSELVHMESNNNIVILLQTAGLTNNGFYYVVLYDDVNRNFSLQSVSRELANYFKYDFNNTSWDVSEDSKSDSVLYVFYSQDYDQGDDTGNDFLYAEQTYILPVFATDEHVRTPILFASQSDPNALDYRNRGLHRWNRPRLDSTKMSMIIDENRRGPGIFFFSDFSMGYTASIEDGGLDMYDTGNYLIADLNTIYYTHTQIEQAYGMEEAAPYPMGLPVEYFKMDGTVTHDDNLGTASSYFTNMYPGLFVFSAGDVDINQFGIGGSTGLDGYGLTYSNNFQITSSASNVYQVFVKCLYHDEPTTGSDPSINQLIIVDAATASGIEHIVAANTDDDVHSIVGLSGIVSKVHYLLLAQRCDIRINDQELESIARTYINMVDGMSQTQTLNELNANYRTITNIIDNTSANFSYWSIDADGNQTSELIDTMFKNENIDYPRHGKLFTNYASNDTIEMFGATGWGTLPQVEGRSWTTMKKALNNQIGNRATTTDLIMWSLASGLYYKIDFTYWQNNAGGGFAYTRQLITEAMDEPVIAFTQSAGGVFDQVDVIEPGVLELSRGSWGPLVNLAVQNKIYSSGPVGTLWNSQYSTQKTVKYTLIDRDGNYDTVQFKESPEKEDWWVDTYYALDFVESKTYYSTDGTWQTLEEFYEEDWTPTNYITEDRYNITTSTFTSERRNTARILNKDGISATFSFTEAGPELEILSIECNQDSIVCVLSDVDGYHISYRDLAGNLIDTVQLSDANFANSYNVRHNRNIRYVTYRSYSGQFRAYTFDGSTIRLSIDTEDTNSNYQSIFNERYD